MLPFLEPAQLPADAIEVGRVLDAWGLKGGFKVLPYSASPEALFSSKRWYLLPPEPRAGIVVTKPHAVQGTQLLRISTAKEHGDSITAQAVDCDDRTSAESLKGARIFIARSSFPTAGIDEFYWVDLMGLKVVTREGLELGTVKDLISTGPQTVLVIETQAFSADGKKQETLIPFVSAYIDKVSLQDQCITVDWQADY
jgi:16S rRNA processing protein RimM